MSIKITMLKSGEDIISDVHEVMLPDETEMKKLLRTNLQNLMSLK